MADSFRFSPRPNRAAEIHWYHWDKEAFDAAETADRPVLLNLTAVWCAWCQRLDETTYSDPEVIELINEEMVPIRVDAEKYPHLQERYIAGGWPTNAFLTPTGEVLWAGTYIEPAEFLAVARGVLAAWGERRDELQGEIERRRRALEAARSRQLTVGLVRREAADDVVSAIYDSFDPRNGGFGTAPKFPVPEAIELLFTQAERLGDPASQSLAEQTLDGILAGELIDRVDGGSFRYALAEDWTDPRREKPLDVNAGLLRAYALGARLLDRGDWREIAEGIVDWAERRLRLEGGLWGGSQAADEEYYSAPEDERGGLEPPFIDTVLYTNLNAAWIRALAEAGGWLGRSDWIERAATAFELLIPAMAAPAGLLYHYREPGGEPRVAGLLADTVESARAAIALAQATGRSSFLETARHLVRGLETELWADDGGFLDHAASADGLGALRYRERPFDRNAAAARLYLDLFSVTGARSYRAIAERTLALLSPAAGRYGVAGAEFALAVDEFFEPVPRVVVVGETSESQVLREAALRLPVPSRRVWSMPDGGRLGAIRFPASESAVAYLCIDSTRSEPITDPANLVEMVRVGR